MRRNLAILNASFPLAGTMMTYLGTLLPLLTTRWKLSDAQAGELFTAQFAGAMSGSLTQGFLAERIGAHRCVPLGFALMAIGTAGVAFGDGLIVGAIALFLTGIGIGWAVPAENWLAGRYSAPEDEARAINVLNAWWCVGAVVGPALIARGLAVMPFEWTLGIVTVVVAAIAVLSWGLTDAQDGELRLSSTADSRRRVRNLALIVSAMLFLYVGTETAFSGWTPTLAARELGLTAADASLAQSAFWASVLVARVLVSFTKLSRWVGMRSLVVGLSSMAAGVALMTVPRNRVGLALGVVLAGIGCATIFPTIIALFQKRAGAGSESWVGIVIAAGSLGASTIPWVVGASAGGLGGLRWSLLAILVVAIAGIAGLLPAMRDGSPSSTTTVS
ncbi:MAG TPA: MFS transporter [Bryobacteraceae bacterium]